MKIQGLTALQRDMADLLWACDSTEQVIELRNRLPKSLKVVLDQMLLMITVESIDEEVVNEEDCSQARDLLSRY